MQPTGGGLMLGNYLGALKNWVTLQNEGKHESIFCIVDMHAITMAHDPKEVLEKSYILAALYLASGIDPDKSLIFIQSHNPAHAELSWILGCHTWMGELSRMTQYKDKSSKLKNIGVGLFYYPILMAADILLYQANLVPVGADQKQHIELARDIAIRMNGNYTKDSSPLFVVPEPYIPKAGARIMSLQEPTAKMSKSDQNPNATVFLMESDDTILKKIKRAVTDSGTEITYSDDKPGIQNLINIQNAITGESIDALISKYSGKQYGHLKVDTAEMVVNCIKPVREKALSYLKDKSELNKILRKSAERAIASSEKTLSRAKELVGFIPHS